MIEKNAIFRVLILITTPKSADKAAEVLKAEGIPVEFRMAAVGTATSEIMDMLGLGGIDKTVMFSMVPKPRARDILEDLCEEIELRSANGGIAFTIPLTGVSNVMMRIMNDKDNAQEKEVSTVGEKKYSMIAAVINRGYSNDAMDAARSAGAFGGTVINSRQLTDEAVSTKWGIGTQEERENVIIAANSDNKVEIMQAITEKCGVQTKANGIVMSVPIDDIIGIRK